MSMCSGCTYAADLTANNRERPGEYVCRLRVPHPCLYPHSCTCQHGGHPPVPVGNANHWSGWTNDPPPSSDGAQR